MMSLQCGQFLGTVAFFFFIFAAGVVLPTGPSLLFSSSFSPAACKLQILRCLFGYV